MTKRLADVEVWLHDISTEKAVFVSLDGEKKNGVWLPRSQIEIDKRQGNIAIITAPEWLLLDKGLI